MRSSTVWRRICVGSEPCGITGEVARVASRHERPRDELRGASGGKKVRQHLVVARLRQRHVDDPRAIRLQLRVDVLKLRHVLADHEEVILPLVDGLELEDRVRPCLDGRCGSASGAGWPAARRPARS